MEGGQKVSINLESPLDTKSSDMLVNVNEAKFAHNRQKYQGHVLPTSLRYEHNGWAAGWYVYEFDFAGGNIFSTQSDNSVVPYLAAFRSRINNTPTYVLSIKAANSNDIEDEQAVRTATEFQAWYTSQGYINAKSCKEAVFASVDPSNIHMRFNYAIDGVDSINTFTFKYDPCTPDVDPVFGNAGNGLTIDFEGLAGDGLVTAVLNNNNYKWEYTDDIHIPINLYQDNIRYAEFSNVTSGVVTWKFSTKDGVHDIILDGTGYKFDGSNINGNTLSVLTTYTVSINIPFKKYFASYKGLNYTVQGNRVLYNTEDTEDPINKYAISTSSVSVVNDSIHDKQNEFTLQGPDVNIVTELNFSLTDLPSNVNSVAFFDANRDAISHSATAGALHAATAGKRYVVPIFNIDAYGFKMPGSSEEHDVMIQVYFKYNGGYLTTNNLSGRECHVDVATYPGADMGRYNEVIQSGIQSVTDTPDLPGVIIDGKPAQNVAPVNLSNNNIDRDQLHIKRRTIWGRQVKANFNIQAINGVSYGSSITSIASNSINTNLIFSRYSERSLSPVAWSSPDTDLLKTYEENMENSTPAGIGGWSYSVHESAGTGNSGYGHNWDFEVSGLLDYVYAEGTNAGGSGSEEGGTGSSYSYKWTTGYLRFGAWYLAPPGTHTSRTDTSNFVFGSHRQFLYAHLFAEYKGSLIPSTAVIFDVSTPWDGGDFSFSIEYNGRQDIDLSAKGRLRSVSATSWLTIKQFDIRHNLVYTEERGLICLDTDDLQSFSEKYLQSSGDLKIDNFDHFWVSDDLKKVVFRDTNGNYFIVDVSYTDHWLTAINMTSFEDDAAIFNHKLLNEHFVIDILDKATGKLLVDHETDVVTFDKNSSFKVYLRKNKLVWGKLYYFDCFRNDTGSSLGSQLSKIYKIQNRSNAFFPINKYSDANGMLDSVYSAPSRDTYGCCQGIAVFNTFGMSTEGGTPPTLCLTLMSPLKSYIIPPSVEDNCLSVYARRTFTHNIKAKTKELKPGVYYISGDTLVKDFSVEPRSVDNVYHYLGNDDIESNNSFYMTDSLLKPVAATFVDNELNVTFRVDNNTDNTVIINGSTYNLSTSELSVKMAMDLNAYYLPEYDMSTKYQLVFDDDNVVNHKTMNDIRGTIADLEKYWLSVTNYEFTFNDATGETTTVMSVEVHNNEDPVVHKHVKIIGSSSKFTSEDYINNGIVETTPVDLTTITDNQLTLKFDFQKDLDYNLPDISSDIFSYDVANGNVQFIDKSNSENHGVYNYKENTFNNVVIGNKPVYKASIELVDHVEYNGYAKYTVNIDQAINTNISFKYPGIYKVVGIDGTVVSSITWNGIYNCTFNVQGKVPGGMSQIPYTGVYSFNLEDFEDKTKCVPTSLTYKSTDVRTNKTKEFAKVLCESEQQLIKQQWDSTVATENIWWIDSSHILTLTKDRLILKEKDISAQRLHDWDGDNWVVVQEYNRTDYLDSEADTMLVSSANGKNAKGYLYVLSPESLYTLRVDVYDVLNGMTPVHIVEGIDGWRINFNNINLGNVLNENNYYDYIRTFQISSYTEILANCILSDSKISAVNVDGEHWLGIQYDNNMNQWSFNLSTGEIVQGYGCIGVNGCATGGMIPAKYFGTTGAHALGFTGTVHDIEKLDKEDVNIDNIATFHTFDERVVGDENQQWYISEQLKDIVIAYNLRTGKTTKLPITNTYSQIYASPSFARYSVYALNLSIKPLKRLFDGISNPIWDTIVSSAGYPMLMYLSPYTNVINYLQQTIGQYAYVHYNTTSIGKRSLNDHANQDVSNQGLSDEDLTKHINTLVSDDLSFDVQHIAQEQSFKDNTWNNILGIFASMVISATDRGLQNSISVNTLQNQSAVSDIGRKFSQAFEQNIGSMSVTGFTMQSAKPMLKSEVTALKTLDMFYSTSAGQECFAGPGFVNANFVAQCTAQSATSLQLEAQQTQVFLLIKELTLWQMHTATFITDKLVEFMEKQASDQSAGPSAGFVVQFGWVISLALGAAAYALAAAKFMQKLAIEAIGNIIDTLFPNGLKTNVTAQLSRHNYDIEGKHAYGNKSEHFYWPCQDCTRNTFADEQVEAVLQKKPWPLEMPVAEIGNQSTIPVYTGQPANITSTPARLLGEFNGDVEYNIASCKGKHSTRALPADVACVIGTNTFLPETPFRNDNIGEGEPVFTTPAVQDYILDKNWNIYVTAMAGDALWVSIKDTKLFDGNYSNIILTDTFCGIAAPHVAVEVKHGISKEYLRPWAVTPDAIALNITGLNCAYDEVAYHAFDGYGYRITNWVGSSGMNKEHYSWQYCFQINDRFKRSNKLPPNQFMGDFQSLPSMSLDCKDKIFNEVTVTSESKGLRTGVAGENKDTLRYALPIFTEQISTLPAIVRALSPYKLAVIDGITSLTTDVRGSQNVYKIPDSVDFNINDKIYRMTNEYICSVEHHNGIESVKYLVPALGLTYLGATPFMAYLYNQATRQFYIYQGGNTLQVVDMLERFRDIKGGYYDFINQEVVMPCLATFSRLDKKVKDDADETDNIIIPVFRHNKVGGEITPPITTIFNTRSWYKTISTPAGLVFQGPNRCIINRFVWSQYMLDDIKKNKGKWGKVPREEYHPFRKYNQQYTDISENVDSEVKGWTHNPFLLVTAPLGLQEEVDCKFEWEITFAWTTEMEQLYEANEYVVVNIMAETMCPGGKIVSRPTHVFLTKELFTRTNSFGYYSFRYQSNAGIGNRERLHIWSDGYIAISSLQLEYTPKTEKRNEILTIQEDVKGMKEM